MTSSSRVIEVLRHGYFTAEHVAFQAAGRLRGKGNLPTNGLLTTGLPSASAMIQGSSSLLGDLDHTDHTRAMVQAGGLQDWRHGRHAGQHHSLPPTPAWLCRLCLQIWRHVQ